MLQSGYDERYDYRVDILPRRNLVRASAGDHILAESRRTLLVDEQNHGLVFYFPRDDVDFARLVRVDHHSVCPYKGEASYWRLADGSDNIAWSYEQPLAEVARLAGHVAFYQDLVRVELGTAAPFARKADVQR